MKENVHEQTQHKPYWNRSFGIWLFIYLALITVGFYTIAIDSFESDEQSIPQSENQNKLITDQIKE